MQATFDRLTRLIEKRYAAANGGAPGAFALRLEGRPPIRFGHGEPGATIVVRKPEGLAALSTMDSNTVAEAYLADSIDVEGDIASLLGLRDLFSDRHPLRFAYRFVRPWLFGQVASDHEWISHHYDLEADFYLLWLDQRHRAYSHGYFAHDDEPLEDAVTRKLDTAVAEVGAQPGQRVLDVGGGWGAFTQYGGQRGLQVTSVTISGASQAFIQGLIDREGLPCRVVKEHLFEHQAEPYDAIVNLGVTEHLPDYAETLRHYRRLLKPGGRVFLDASASRKKYAVGTFLERHIFPGNGSTACLHDYLKAVAESPFEVLSVHNDRYNYLLTARHWAESLDRHAAEIERRWSRAVYRKFRIYLWGCVDGFTRDVVQAYHWTLRRD